MIHSYNTKYVEGDIEDKYKIISYADEGNYYNKYICKNSKGNKFVLFFSNTTNFKKGDIVIAKGKFELPELVRNHGGFNHRRYLNSQRIYGNVFVSKYYLEEVASFNFIFFIQDEILKTFSKLFPKNEMGLIIGMMIGETKDISEETLNSFKKTGITHLLAVSGTNVMYVMLCVSFIFQRICGKRKTYYISILFLIIFMLVSGASSSVIRATIMCIITILADIFYKKSDTLNNVYISACILLICNPLIVYDVGFVLSFSGTLGIILLSNKIENHIKHLGVISSVLSVTISAQMALLPIMAYYFNSISLIAILTNLIIVPISGFITILGFFIFLISSICFPVASIFSKALYILAHFTIVFSDLLSRIPFSSIKVITPNIFEIIIYYYVIFLIIKKVDFKKIYRIVAIFLLVEILVYNFPHNYINVCFIDVGQGDAIYIKTNKNKNILIDGGGSDSYDIGEKILVPYLLDRRVVYIDSIFSSHSDNDHLNGIISAIENFKVNKIYIAKDSLGYERLFEVCIKRNVKLIELTEGDIIKIDDVSFRVIGPTYAISNKSINDYSLVLLMNYKSRSILFTGDISKDVELKLKNIKADILKVAHHGSNSSSSERFVSRVNPSISIIQVGKNNKFGHPCKDTVDILKRYSEVYTTSICGEIRLKIFEDIIKIE